MELKNIDLKYVDVGHESIDKVKRALDTLPIRLIAEKDTHDPCVLEVKYWGSISLTPSKQIECRGLEKLSKRKYESGLFIENSEKCSHDPIWIQEKKTKLKIRFYRPEKGKDEKQQ